MSSAALDRCPFYRGPASIELASLGDSGFTAGCIHDGAVDPQMCVVAPRTLPMRTRGRA